MKNCGWKWNSNKIFWILTPRTPCTLPYEYAKSQVKVLTCKTLLKPLWVSGLLWSLIAHGLLLEFLMLTNYSSWEITNAPPNIIPNNALHKDLYTSIWKPWQKKLHTSTNAFKTVFKFTDYKNLWGLDPYLKIPQASF